MLAGTAIAWPGYLSLISAVTASTAAGLREEITTLAPCSAMRSAIALPMPLVEPVMMATLPVRSKSSGTPARALVSVATDMARLSLKRSFDLMRPSL